MQSKSDAQLLREYVRSDDESAFSELVTRHTNLVYSAAVRQSDSRDMAAEASQQVFIALARGAKKLSIQLSEDASLAGWLCRCARNISLNVRRNEYRKQSRERQTMEELHPNSESTPDWEHLRPVLDGAMAELSETDYDALVMRFFNNQDLRVIGKALGVTDDTAQKRVSRALEKLRHHLSRRGIHGSAAALSLVLSANAVQSAPLGLSASISASTALSAAAIKSTTLGLTKTLFMTTMQKAVIATFIAAAVSTGIYEARRVTHLQQQTLAMERQRDQLTTENGQLRRLAEDSAGRLAVLAQESGSSPDRTNELLRLRAEAARNRESARELAQLKASAATGATDTALEATLKTWAARAALLHQRLEQMPDKKIPELQLLSDREWFDAVKSGKPLETDADIRKALEDLRNSAKENFANLTRAALKKYVAANNGFLPSDLSQLNPYFETPVDNAILQRYALLQSGELKNVPREENLFAEKAAPVDPEFDSYHEFSMNGSSSWSTSDPKEVVERSINDFAKNHDGVLPSDASQLEPYLRRPVDPSQVKTILALIPSGVTTLNQLRGLDH